MKNIKNRECDNQPSEAILESHISSYLDKIGFVLFWILFAITLAEIAICILIKMNYFLYFLEFHNNIKMNYYNFVKLIAVNSILLWISYIIYLIAFQKSDFRQKKILISITVMTITTVLCFGHWKYNFLSIIYSLPVVFTAPLGKRSHGIVFSISIVISILYSVLQYKTFNMGYNFLICLISIISITTFYLISKYFYIAMLKTLTDLEKYFLLTNQLHDAISHDFLTGAFSKQKLMKDFESNVSFKSLAFIDIDNFKEINDSKGHNIGDNILKIFTKDFIIRNINLYRYGGDEFVVLSEDSPAELAEKLEKIKLQFINISKKLFLCNATFSAGIISLEKKSDITKVLKKCDNLMYYAKKQGKNAICLEEQYHSPVTIV